MTNPGADNQEEDLLALTMSVEDWLFIDGTIDNTVAIAAVDGAETVVGQGHAIRAAGWAATRAHPRNKDGWGGWPPTDDEITVALPPPAWRFVVDELYRWERVMADDGADVGAVSPDAGKPGTRGFAVAHRLVERLSDASREPE
ncbi:hypothetical protein [Pseudarthrobacter raffinosi]|uniref:hypothetical protein n=1 Tax=Pseudarthrobacter raffinosi TaxID=2953651 RepID=UPI00208E5F96|nr:MULTISPECIES: hypothetical protein [unclassified Pseudarthrobacter]MCO4237651.1 hypothetical protein [Pseudarthrobacter sp. MDT3-28]MCO4252208.1 hypothetical protein [Pseudarthrobacter sp. MDT3-9]MCO4264346.1 hypothetical protein [Pseudarthrobacter sp. MDT3-26]